MYGVHIKGTPIPYITLAISGHLTNHTVSTQSEDVILHRITAPVSMYTICYHHSHGVRNDLESHKLKEEKQEIGTISPRIRRFSMRALTNNVYLVMRKWRALSRQQCPSKLDHA